MIRILLVHDVERIEGEKVYRWAHAHRTAALQKYAPRDCHVERCSYGEMKSTSKDVDLVFCVDPSITKAVRMRFRDAVIVASFNRDLRHDSDRLRLSIAVDFSDWVVFNNRRAYELSGLSKSSHIHNGVDTDWWKPCEDSRDEYRVLWTGSSTPSKGKGWQEILQPLIPLAKDAGFICDFRPIANFDDAAVVDVVSQREWYQRGSYYVSASTSEGGGPNTVMEAMACGCVPICTPVGGIPEYGRDGENMIIVGQREPHAFLRGLERARDTYRSLSQAALATMQQWSYGAPAHVASRFFSLFDSLLKSRS